MFNFAPAIPSRSDLDWCWYLRREGPSGEALERVLHDIGVMQPGGWADWQSSTMTQTGAPVEMIFKDDDSALSLRTEIDDPALDPTARFAKVCTLIGALGGTPPPVALRDIIGAAQTGSDLRFGAWLGLRRCADKLGASVLAEFPAEASDLVGLVASGPVMAALRRLGDGIRISMIGYDGQNGDITLHCETTKAPAFVVPVLAKTAHVLALPLLRRIDEMVREGGVHTHKPEKWGFSLTLHKKNIPPTLTLLFSGKALFQTDALISSHLNGVGGKHLETYTALTDHLLPAPRGKTHHGQIGLRARSTQAPLLSVSVAAPWICPFENA